MMKFLRSQSQTVLVIVLGVIGLGLLFYGSSGNVLTSSGGRVSNDFGRIDGEDLSMSDLYDAVRTTRDGLILRGQGQALNQPGVSGEIAEEAWRQLLLLHEADKLHIQVSDQELYDLISKKPEFQKDGVYSPELYQSRMTMLKDVLHLPADAGVDPIASAKAVYETVLRNEVRAQAVERVLFAQVRSSALGVESQYEKFSGPATVSLITFDPKTYIQTAQVTPGDIEDEYKAHPENSAYRTPEKRKVDYVLFMLTPDQAKLADKDKTAAKNALGEKALDFALAFQPDPTAAPGKTPPPPDFMAEAQKRGLSPATTDFFTADTPPANVPPSPAFNSTAFSLTKDNAVSRVIELENGVAVLHLAEIQASDLRPLDQVKGDIEKNLREAKASLNAQIQLQTADQTLKAAMAKGTDFKTAAAALNLKVETLPVFVPTKTPPNDQRLEAIAEAVTTLSPGQVSDPVPIQSDNTTLIIHLDERAKADPAGLAAFEIRFRQSQDEQLRNIVYSDWAEWLSKQPGTHKPPDLQAYGSVE